jgi:hypothetical protein
LLDELVLTVRPESGQCRRSRVRRGAEAQFLRATRKHFDEVGVHGISKVSTASSTAVNVDDNVAIRTPVPSRIHWTLV